MDKDFDKTIEDLKEKAESILSDDEGINKLLKDVKEKFDDNEFLSTIASDVRLIVEMVTAWKNGEYTGLSQNTVILVIAGLLYIANPLNMLPKLLKKTIIDDILIIIYIVKKIKTELEAYKNWKADVDYSPEDRDRNYIEL